MKKTILLCGLACFCIALVGCGSNIETQIKENLSDVRYNVFVGKNSDITVSLMSGMRENPYNYDGVSNKKCEFGIVTMTSNSIGLLNSNFVLKVDGAEIVGVLEENPYDHSFMTDIEKIVDCESVVYITIENIVENMILTCQSLEWQVQYDDALKIGVDSLLEDAQRFVDGNKLKAESYLKIIFDQSSNNTPYYWYFGIVGENGENIAVIINPQTGEIITRNPETTAS